jgi:hypothetical protein
MNKKQHDGVTNTVVNTLWDNDKKEQYADIMRKLSEHENNVMNMRFSWFTTLQGLLFAGLVFCLKENINWLAGIIGGTGLIVPMSFYRLFC